MGTGLKVKGLSINLATVRQQFGFAAAVDACLAQGITAIAPWRDQVEVIGLHEAVRIVEQNGLQVTGYCRGGMFPATNQAGLAAAIDDNKRAIDEAAALGADCLVLVVGGLPGASCPGFRSAASYRASTPYVRRRSCVREHTRAGARSV
jgi:sugar phosphate isomerase/epimerase